MTSSILLDCELLNGNYLADNVNFPEGQEYL